MSLERDSITPKRGQDLLQLLHLFFLFEFSSFFVCHRIKLFFTVVAELSSFLSSTWIRHNQSTLVLGLGKIVIISLYTDKFIFSIRLEVVIVVIGLLLIILDTFFFLSSDIVDSKLSCERNTMRGPQHVHDRREGTCCILTNRCKLT